MKTHPYIDLNYTEPYRILKRMDVSPAEALEYYNSQIDLGRSPEEVGQEIEMVVIFSPVVEGLDSQTSSVNLRYHLNLEEMKKEMVIIGSDK